VWASPSDLGFLFDTKRKNYRHEGRIFDRHHYPQGFRSNWEINMEITKQVFLCIALIALTAINAFSTNPSTTGAFLTITGTVSDGVNTMPISLSVSDKDIHSGNPQTVGTTGTCTVNDEVTTDAFVMQAGAPTGCDPGNPFEGNLSSGTFTFTAPEGSLVLYNLGVTTTYVVLAEGTRCNTSETICSNNTSFLTVMNNSGSVSFTGTITLAASSPNCSINGGDGLVFDSFTGTLPADVDASATLALANDASGCGGFTTLSQTQTLEPGVQSIYTFLHDDKYKITPFFNAGGESLTITYVPVLYSQFTPPANFLNEACVPFADVSPTNPSAPLATDVCVTYQADCVQGTATVNDCSTLLYEVLESYDLPPNLPAIGGPDYLLVHGSGCPTSSSALALSIFTDYFVTRLDPTTKGKGQGTGSCFEATSTPGAPLVTSGTTSRFVGWQSPVDDNQLNQVKAGSTRPLAFSWSDNQGNPITNLSYCTSFTMSNSGNVCQDSPTVPTPWVNLSSFGIVCPNGAPINPSTDDSTITTSGSSAFQNLGGGNYQMNWKTSKSWKGSCADIQVTFDSGVTEVPATLGFQFN
jgi:hypothetical protein